MLELEIMLVFASPTAPFAPLPTAETLYRADREPRLPTEVLRIGVSPPTEGDMRKLPEDAEGTRPARELLDVLRVLALGFPWYIPKGRSPRIWD